MAETDRLTAPQNRAIAALVGGSSLAEAAAAAGCSDRTLRRWRDRPEFQAALGAAQHETYSRTINRIVTASIDAIATLQAMAKNPKVSDSARVSAAQAILSHAHNAYSQRLLEARLEQLEAMLDEQ